MADLETQEMKRLERAVTDVESLLARSPESRTPLLTAFLQNAKMEIARIEHRQREDERQQSEAQSRLRAAAEHETALTREEQREFTGFLKEEFFTKKDFAALEQFYAHAYGRLSESGREAMSQRIWGGIRRDEYAFAELPKVIREKEMERAYSVFVQRDKRAGAATEVLESDRAAFITAYETGHRDEAARILERQSFKETMFRGGEAKGAKHADASLGRESESDALLEGLKPITKEGPQKNSLPETIAVSDLDLSVMNFDGMNAAKSPVEMANANPAKPRGR